MADRITSQGGGFTAPVAAGPFGATLAVVSALHDSGTVWIKNNHATDSMDAFILYTIAGINYPDTTTRIGPKGTAKISAPPADSFVVQARSVTANTIPCEVMYSSAVQP